MELWMDLLVFWLPSLLVISVCVWTLFGGSRKNMSGVSNATPTGGNIHTMGQRKTARIASIVFLIGAATGYMGRSWQLAHNTKSLPETLILNALPDGSYDMLDSYGRVFNTAFCSGPETLERGNKLKQFVFIQRTGCKEIHGPGLGYLPYRMHGVRQVFPIPMEVSQNAR
jgi:hypothetical protein